MRWWNNGKINRRSATTPGPGFNSGRMYFKRSSPTKKTRLKMSDSLKGKRAWNKGVTTGPEPEITKLKKSLAAKKRDNSVYKGQIPWNLGISADKDSRVLSYVTQQKGQKRKGNYTKGILHPNWNPNLKEYKRYRYRVMLLSEKNYVQNHLEINPNNHPRTLAGVSGGYHLDHIRSVKHGFLHDMSPDMIASKENLQMLPWRDNVRKGSK